MSRSGHMFLLNRNKLGCMHVSMTALTKGIPYGIQKHIHSSLIFIDCSLMSFCTYISRWNHEQKYSKQAGLNFQIPARACKQDFEPCSQALLTQQTKIRERLSPLCSTLPEAKWPKWGFSTTTSATSSTTSSATSSAIPWPLSRWLVRLEIVKIGKAIYERKNISRVYNR